MISKSIIILNSIIYILIYLVTIPFVLSFILMILFGILKNKTKMQLNDKKVILISIFLSVVLSIILSNNITTGGADRVSINSQKDSDLKFLINQIIDLNEQRTEIIYAKTEEIYTYAERYEHKRWRIDFQGTRHYKDSNDVQYYFLNIRDGEYIITLSNNLVAFDTINQLLYNKEYGNQLDLTNKIEVYKNTKFVKSINGIDIDSNAEIIQNFVNEKEYKIKMDITEDGYLTYETEGCTLDDYIHNENAMVSVFNQEGEQVANTIQIFGSDNNLLTTFSGNLNINKLGMYCYPDGIYTACVCTRENKGDKGKKVSNSIEFKIEKRKVIEFNVIQN